MPTVGGTIFTSKSSFSVALPEVGFTVRVPDALKLSHNLTFVALPLFAHPALNVV